MQNEKQTLTKLSKGTRENSEFHQQNTCSRCADVNSFFALPQSRWNCIKMINLFMLPSQRLSCASSRHEAIKNESKTKQHKIPSLQSKCFYFSKDFWCEQRKRKQKKIVRNFKIIKRRKTKSNQKSST